MAHEHPLERHAYNKGASDKLARRDFNDVPPKDTPKGFRRKYRAAYTAGYDETKRPKKGKARVVTGAGFGDDVPVDLTQKTTEGVAVLSKPVLGLFQKAKALVPSVPVAKESPFAPTSEPEPRALLGEVMVEPPKPPEPASPPMPQPPGTDVRSPETAFDRILGWAKDNWVPLTVVGAGIVVGTAVYVATRPSEEDKQQKALPPPREVPSQPLPWHRQLPAPR